MELTKRTNYTFSRQGRLTKTTLLNQQRSFTLSIQPAGQPPPLCASRSHPLRSARAVGDPSHVSDHVEGHVALDVHVAGAMHSHGLEGWGTGTGRQETEWWTSRSYVD